MSYLIQNEVIKDLDQQAQIDYRNKILSQKDLYDVLPFGKTKIKQLIASKQLPLFKIGKDYVISPKIVGFRKVLGKNLTREAIAFCRGGIFEKN